MEKDVRKDGRGFYDNARNCGVFVNCGVSFLVNINWVWDLLDNGT